MVPGGQPGKDISINRSSTPSDLEEIGHLDAENWKQVGSVDLYADIKSNFTFARASGNPTTDADFQFLSGLRLGQTLVQ